MSVSYLCTEERARVEFDIRLVQQVGEAGGDGLQQGVAHNPVQVAQVGRPVPRRHLAAQVNPEQRLGPLHVVVDGGAGGSHRLANPFR